MATQNEITSAYRKLIRQYHPDKCAPENKYECEETSKRLNEVYVLLRDPKKRGSVDLKLRCIASLKPVLRNKDYSRRQFFALRLGRSELSNILFNRATLSDVQFKRANMKNIKFINAALDKVDFSKAVLENVDFGGAILKNVDFSGATLNSVSFDDASFESVVIDEKTIFHDITFIGAYKVPREFIVRVKSNLLT